MSKVFTIDDVEEVTLGAWMSGVNDIWCHIKFKGGQNPVQFCASPDSDFEFSRDMYVRLKEGQFGELSHGFGPPYRGRPDEQDVVEANAKAKRNQLLLESDYTDLPSTQARLTDEEKAAWADYRQALRDITSHPAFPWDPEWPAKP